MYHEILTPEQEAETAAWWREAFKTLDELISHPADETARSR
jgi:hypothetical protein